jgi:tetratricopeptide (TPR) repeat protein
MVIKKLPALSRGAAPAVAILVLLAGLALAWVVNGKAYEENRAILSGLSQQSGGLTQNLADFQQAISYNTYGNQEAREQLTQVASEIATAPSSEVSDDIKNQFLNVAATQMQLQEQVSPLDARFPLFLGTLLDSYGQYAQAQTALEKAHELSPDKQTILFELAMNAQARGDTAGALNDFAQAYNLEPDYLDARLYYAAAAIEAGDDATADQLLAPITASGEAADSRIAAAYASRKEYSKIIPLWQAHIAVDPTDSQAYFTLAAAYYAGGQSAQAISELKAVEQVDPSSVSQAQTLIQQIQSGTAKLQ